MEELFEFANEFQRGKWKNYTVQLASTEDLGVGFAGHLTPIKVRANAVQGKTFNLVVKKAPKKEPFRKILEIERKFQVEIAMYEKVLPAFLKFQQQEEVQNPFRSWPECYYTNWKRLEESLVLEDLKFEGFESPRREMDEEHIDLVLGELAKFHATSYAVKNKNFELFAELKHEILPGGFFTVFETMKNALCMHLDIVIRNLSVDDDDLKQKLISCKGFIRESLSVLSQEVDEHSVILHGDCWLSNIMFKYENNQPKELRLIDWQLCMIGSPMLDFAFFFYSSATRKVLENVQNHLKFYHESLRDHLGKFGIEVDEVFPFEILLKHFKRYSQIGFFTALYLVRFLHMNADEVPFVEDLETPEEIEECFNSDLARNNEYVNRMKELTEHFINNDLLNNLIG